jgi:voltage-gated potassium channel Kch
MNKKNLSSFTTFGRWSRKYSWWLVIGMLATAAVLVITGVVLIIVGRPEQQKLLFNIAKILGAGGTALGSIKAFWKQIREKYDLIRLQQISGHVVISGLGDKGMRLVSSFLEKGNRVVVIEVKKDHPDIPGCGERGVLVLIGDASDPVILDEANTAKAKYLFAVTGNDSTNIKMASEGKLLAEAAYKDDETVFLRCYTHIASSKLKYIFAYHDLFAKTYDEFDASIFNIYETSARVILEKYPPDLYAQKQELSGETIPILVIGFSMMGENIIKQTARIGHYAKWRRLKITVVDRHIKTTSEKFLAVYGDGKTPPSFIVPGFDIRFIDRDPECLLSIEEITGSNSSKPVAVYIALDDDSIGVSLALRIRSLLASDDTPIIVCMRSSLSDLMKGNESQYTLDRNIHGFNIYDAACGYQALMDEVTDELARTIHSAYVNTQIPFTESDFKQTKPLDFMHAVLQDIPGVTNINEEDPIASLNRIMKMPSLYDHIHSKREAALTTRVKTLANRTTSLRSKPFHKLDITDQTQLLRLNASLLDAAYPTHYPQKKRDNISLVLWEELNEVMKDANRWPADHLSVKLRAIGCDGHDLTPLDKIANNPEFFEMLSEMEHRRWMAERLMDGWRYGQIRNNKKKIHPLLVPYERLSESEKQKDKDMLVNIRNLLASPGWKKQRQFIAD